MHLVNDIAYDCGRHTGHLPASILTTNKCIHVHAAVQVDMVEAGAVPMLVRLLSVAEPDGQYSAAAALFNLAGFSAHVQDRIIIAGALPALVPMLTADSW